MNEINANSIPILIAVSMLPAATAVMANVTHIVRMKNIFQQWNLKSIRKKQIVKFCHNKEQNPTEAFTIQAHQFHANDVFLVESETIKNAFHTRAFAAIGPD